ncbi:hypothetical protein B0H13DRAFT_2338686 [Mycena leptocephala]|nr:hypothetical protein B0H13DRAFT_2338686 [Mycena leptocephala]
MAFTRSIRVSGQIEVQGKDLLLWIGLPSTGIGSLASQSTLSPFMVVDVGPQELLSVLTASRGERHERRGLENGGHISVPKIYPPNEGVLISMKQFNHIKYDKEKKTLDVGAGVIWRDVYKYLELFASDVSDHAPGVVGGVGIELFSIIEKIPQFAQRLIWE